ncbi:FtsK/SpoIIIE domain-containing protein [Clostridium perfringens]|uniref:FtsK/SpoIIIE domain-containing protein n=1 Tax=Clostridium perfringens TaxID=1502 RepID=UPI0024BCC2C5|nr:FtsK/SpoIIIE domain-containing protein [Clostridium perfringens]MDM1009510.1 FtsK/SpoIIIE domain-containing protein [Clostridium perfringens]
MKFYKNRRLRIKASDKTLVINLITKLIIIDFMIIFILVHLKQITKFNLVKIKFRYFIISIVISLLISCFIMFIYYYFERHKLKQLIHRQKLARMILENKWYESESIKDSGFFKDLNSNKQKEKIVYFPKMYYELKNGLIYIKVEITLGKYQDQLLNLEKKLESGLYCELVSKELKDSYIEYVLLYDTIANRISIDEAKVKDGSLKLMKSVYWEFDKLPHMLIAGGTGGGKTYFILTIIEALLSTDSILYVLDPKNADLADLKTVMPNVYYKKDDMISCINNFYDEMMRRSEAMKTMNNYKTGENYSYLGLSANFLIFDEYVAFMEMLGTKENSAVLNKLKQIVMLGRQAGFFLILACQRPDAKYLGDGIRDQFNFRVALGRMSELGYNMMFGESNKEFFLKQIKGRGYVDIGTNVISEFYTPLVPKGHDFLKQIDKIIKSRQVEESSCEAKDEVSD